MVNESGYSLIELLVVLTIASIGIVIAVPDYSGLSEPLNRLNARSVVLQDIKRAQAETITTGCRGILEVINGGRGYQFGCDYLPYDNSPEPSSDEVTLTRNLPINISLTTSSKIIFNSRGQSVDSDYIFQNVLVSLQESGDTFDQGTLLGTGVFEYD